MKPLVIYHAQCADGFGAAFAAWLKLGDEAEYMPMQYGNIPEPQDLRDLVDHREVYILDFSLPRAGMNELFSEAKRVVFLDHHKTAFEMWCEKERECYIDVKGKHHILLDNNRSGAMLAWEYFHPGTEVPMFIRHIDDYDRWQFKLEGTKAFQKALWSQPFDFKAWKIIFLTPGYEMNAYHLMYREGEAILRAHEQNVQSVVKGGARECRILHIESTGPEHWQAKFDVDAIGLAANCPPHLQSDVGHELAVQSGTFGLLWYVDKNNVCKCSLRSNGDYDVSAIAKAFGGGGHRNAAGFSINIQTLLGWIK